MALVSLINMVSLFVVEIIIVLLAACAHSNAAFGLGEKKQKNERTGMRTRMLTCSAADMCEQMEELFSKHLCRHVQF
jgi:hypothetical protein